MLSLALLVVTLAPAHAAGWPDLSTSPRGPAEGAQDAAVLIGIEDYPFVEDVAGAAANVDAWMAWLKNGRGVPLSRMRVVRDRDANARRIREAISHASSEVGPSGTLWFLFVGHGAPSKDGRDGLLVGANADRTAEGIYYESVPRSEVVAALEASRAARSVAVIDACFSGQSATGQALVSGLQPLVPTALLGRASEKVTVLTAAGSGEFSGPLSGVARPAFSYLALGALRGWADVDGGNADGTVSASEVLSWTKGALVATVRGRTQTPSLIGPDAPLSTVVDRSPPDVLAMGKGRGVVAKEVDVGSASLVAATDFAALAAKAAAAKAAREQTEREARARAEAQAAEQARLEAELSKRRRAELDRLVGGVRARAARDYASVSPLLKGEPTAETRPVLEAFVKQYGDVTVRFDGVVEKVEVAEVMSVAALLATGGSRATVRDWVSPTLGIMKWIPAGTFVMGSPASETGRDQDEVQHEVTLTKGFWMMEHEVTQGEWLAVMGSNPARFKQCGPNCPVEQVSWDAAVEFARRVSARDGAHYALPTEAQWEYAARGGDAGVYAGSFEVGAVAWTGENSGEGTHPVCQKARNGYGLCDMSGNVWEWTADRYGDYAAGASADPDGPTSGPDHVYRGGSWGSTADGARSAFRLWLQPGHRNDDLGLRLIRTIP
jgi:formylglycine-generating enzyme required for sulfatase activity